MTNAIAEAQARGLSLRIRPSYGYYRQPNGWLTVSPASDLDELHYTRKGWTRLGQYGRIEMTAEYAADHPFEALFMLGGVHEFSREQIIESAMHLNPPIVPGCRTPLSQNHPRHNGVCMATAYTVEFPQITEADLVSFQCRFCQRAPFSTDLARDTHEGVMHKEEKSDIRTGETLAAAMVKGLSGPVKETAAPVEAPEPVPATLGPPEGYIPEDVVQARIDAAVKAALGNRPPAKVKADE